MMIEVASVKRLLPQPRTLASNEIQRGRAVKGVAGQRRQCAGQPCGAVGIVGKRKIFDHFQSIFAARMASARLGFSGIAGNVAFGRKMIPVDSSYPAVCKTVPSARRMGDSTTASSRRIPCH